MGPVTKHFSFTGIGCFHMKKFLHTTRERPGTDVFMKPQKNTKAEWYVSDALETSQSGRSMQLKENIDSHKAFHRNIIIIMVLSKLCFLIFIKLVVFLSECNHETLLAGVLWCEVSSFHLRNS